MYREVRLPMETERFEVEPGQYFLGDPGAPRCDVVGIVLSTEGDGTVMDTAGYHYDIETGTIALVPVSEVDAQRRLLAMDPSRYRAGRLITLREPAVLQYHTIEVLDTGYLWGLTIVDAASNIVLVNIPFELTDCEDGIVEMEFVCRTHNDEEDLTTRALVAFWAPFLAEIGRKN